VQQSTHTLLGEAWVLLDKDEGLDHDLRDGALAGESSEL